MKKLLLFTVMLFTVSVSAQIPTAKINETSKKLIMLDAKSDGSVVNIRFDSLIVKPVTMNRAVMSYLEGTLLKTTEINHKYDAYKALIIGEPTDDEVNKLKKYLFAISKISDKQKVLMFEKLDQADDVKKVLIHSKTKYYLKLDDDITDGNYQSDYFYTLKGVLIPDIYEYFLLNIN